jgi:hypothetical protein
MLHLSLTHAKLKEPLATYQDRINRITDMMATKKGPGSDFLGWDQWPATFDETELSLILTTAATIQANYQVLVVVGIGGSYLGARAVIEAMNGLNNQSNSLFFARISPKNAVMGHSMGGGCALLAKQYSTQINHVVTFAAAETNPSAISASSTIDLPSFTIAGTNDCVTPPATNQLPIYNALQSNCKNYLGITGASHCQMANSNFFCSVGEGSCSPSPTITRAQQHQMMYSYLNLWLDYYLKENCVSGELFEAFYHPDLR